MQTPPQDSVSSRREFLKSGSAAAVLAVLGAVNRTGAAGPQQQPLLTHLSAKKLAKLIADRQVSCVKVVEAYLQRIEEVNPKLNAIVQMDAERVRAEAREADQDLSKGVTRGPLHGVPFTIKDQLLTKGIITTNGCPELRSYVPKDDATVVKRLKDAGGILLGKTNVPEMCYHGITDNLVYGRTNNPYDLTRTSNGSSGGEAAMIAAGGSPFGIGTDIGGSIRNPAHVCGIAGIKSTGRRVPETGMLGAFPPFVAHWNGIGPMARYVEDLTLVLKIISGTDGRDPRAMPVPLLSPTDVRKDALKVVYFTDDGGSQPTKETQDAVEKAVEHLRSVGAKVVKDRPPKFQKAIELWMPVMIPSWAVAARHWPEEYARLAHSTVAARRSFLTEWMLKWLDFLQQTGKYTPEHHFELELALEQYQQQMLEFAQAYDVVVSPVSNKPAAPHMRPGDLDSIPFGEFTDVIQREVGSFCMAYNLTGWPAVVVRAGTSPEGLPIGVQIAAQPWREDLALAAAGVIEEGLGGWQPPSM